MDCFGGGTQNFLTRVSAYTGFREIAPSSLIRQPPARIKGKRPHLDNQRLEAYRGAANSLEPINYLLNDTRVCNLFPGISQSEMTNSCDAMCQIISCFFGRGGNLFSLTRSFGIYALQYHNPVFSLISKIIKIN